MRAFVPWVVVFVLFSGSPVVAQPFDQQLNAWRALPEDPAMREPCANDLHYSTEIARRKQNGASLAALLRWAESESEKSAALLPSEPLLPIGTNLILIKLVQRSYLDGPIYAKLPGGFPQWAYRSCLKGKPIDQ